MRNSRVLCIAVMAAALLGLVGCGYSTQSTLDKKYNSVYVAAFHNNGREYDLQAPLTNALRRKFMMDGRLTLVNEDEADLILEGTLLGYRLKGITFDTNDEVTQFLVVVLAGARLTDRATGDVLWEDADLAGESSYYTRAAGQSSDRLRGNADVFLATVRSFASEEENRAASEALEQLASDVFYRTLEPW